MNTKEGIEMILPAFEWLVQASWQAAILAIGVILAQWLLRKRLSARWRSSLWLVVIARLLVPFSPESALSLFNFVRVEPIAMIEEVWQTDIPPEPPLPERPAEKDSAVPSLSGEMGDTSVGPTLLPTPLPTAAASSLQPWEPTHVATLLWLLGATALALHLARTTLKLRREVARARNMSDETVLTILENCKRQMNVRAQIRLLETETVKSPALFGVLRPVLLLPPGTARRFSSVELRYIFLHELAHLKRYDLLSNWVLCGLQILHWFNPVI
jgi:beta-lactamase regulating signal transducer with metallopeptidase domain